MQDNENGGRQVGSKVGDEPPRRLEPACRCTDEHHLTTLPARRNGGPSPLNDLALCF
jgi:hypothetical protein